MSIKLIPPDQPLLDELLYALHHSNDCLFGVAYISNPDESDLRPLFETIERRSVESKFRLRVLFRSVDVRTHPDAIASFIKLAKETNGRIAIRSGDENFHAKAYGFKKQRSDPAKLIIGSANLSPKAVRHLSGEMSVRISENEAAETAWEVLESLFDQGADPSIPGWMEKYRQKYEKRQAIERDAQKIQMPPTLKAKSSVRIPNRFYVMVVDTLESKISESVERGLEKAHVAHVDLPQRPQWTRFENANDAKSFAQKQYRMVLRILRNPNRDVGDRLIRLDFVIPKKHIRLFDSTDEAFHHVVWELKVRGYSATIPYRGDRAKPIRQLLRRKGVDTRWLEAQSDRFAQAATCTKLLNVFHAIRSFNKQQ